MVCWKSGIFLLLVTLLGCQAVIDLGEAAATLDWQQLVTGDLGTSSLDRPAIQDGSVRVSIVNASGQIVDVRLTMRVIGQIVHFAARRIPIGGQDVFIGPDRADSVLVEVTLLTDPPVIRAPLTYFYGQDFNSGDTISVLIEPEPTQPSGGQTGTPSAVALEGLDSDVRVRPGMVAAFAVLVTGDTTSGTRVSALADPDRVPASGDEITIAADLSVAPRIPIQWTVPDLSPGRYSIYAEVRDGGTVVRSAATAGAIRVDAPPQLTFDSPRPNQAVTRGKALVVAWAGMDVDGDNAVIAIFLDTNTTYDGTEPVLRAGISASDLQDRQLTIDTSNLIVGTYYVGGVIDDGLITTVAYAGPVCTTDRLVGRLTPSDLGTGEITTITGGADNRLLGTAVDISRRVSGMLSGIATVLVSDPGALHEIPSIRAAGAMGEVDLYQHDVAVSWPRDLTIDDMTLQMVGEQDLAQTGQAIALLDPIGPENSNADFLIGAPAFNDPCAPINGRAYFLRGSQILALIPTQTPFYLGTLNDSPVGTLFRGDLASATGLGVAALGDIDGSEHDDYAIGATSPPQGTSTGGLGSVYLFSGNARPSGGPIGQTFNYRLDGVGVGDLTGYAITGVADASGDGLAEVAIGAPSARSAGATVGPAVGVVYLVFGRAQLLGTFGGVQSLGELGGAEALEGRIFVGENSGDGAGAALASADFDGDDRPDLLIGAPGFDGGRGRVYLVYDVGSALLPAAPATIELGLVGSVYPGVVFDGLAVGDQLGTAVADGRDFDGDGVRDIVVGAPGVELQRGAVYLIYGPAQRLEGHVALTDIGTCGQPSLEFVGDAGQVSRLGQSLSVGNLHADGRTDIAVGAPGDVTNPGQVHLLFGHPLLFLHAP